MKTLLLASCAALLLTNARGAPISENPPKPAVTLQDFKLIGELSGDQAVFTLTGTARVENPRGGSMEVLAGPVALTELGPHPKWRLRVEGDRYLLSFERGGKFPIQLKFNAAVRQDQNSKSVEFRVAPGVLQPILLRGLAADAQFDFAGAARPQRQGGDFVSYLPSDGVVKLSWKEARPEAEGKLFYAAEMLSHISVSPGLMRQVALVDCKVMQGELNRVALRLRGAGEVTRVQGDQVLAWNVEAVPDSAERRLVIQFNQPQKDQFAFQVQVQTPLGAFPQTVEAVQLRPESATRFAGYFRILNEGAVRLEVAQASGLSQISPEQFPESDATRAAMRVAGSQRFAYRFSGGDFALRLQADQILPELGVSQVLVYHLGENELAIDAEIELDIREAPLRELQLRVPKGYVIARLNAPGSSDYFLRDLDDQSDAELRLAYGQPASGRQVIQLRLERNQPLAEAAWALPRIEIPKAKSVRGHIGVASDAGLRMVPDRTQALTEIATAFFPRQVTGLQAAFRLSDPAWQGILRVERLPQTVQADAFHLFSIGEGIAYGSSLINYMVSGAPVPAFKIELSDEYFNVEFTGKDVRNWQKTDGGYLVQLHTPVSGAYSLLATYERPFKAQGETLAFTGARSLDAQSEQGHTLIVSAYQFQVKPEEVSPGLLALETGEVPPEYRLFFDAPILKAYRYTSRPFDLRLALSPLAQGDSLSQVVDRASFITHVSKEGAALTDARYFLKNRGNPHFRLALPSGTQLWSVSVNGAPVVPVTDAQANLIPLPQRADPNAVLTIDLKLAAAPKEAKWVSVGAPKVDAPVLLTEWKLEPDAGQRLVYRQGSLTPAGGVPDVSGFAQLTRMFGEDLHATVLLLAVLGLMAAALVVWHWTGREAVFKFSARHVLGTLLGLVAFSFALVAIANLGGLADQQRSDLPRDLTFLAPIQQAGSALNLDVGNIEDKPSAFAMVEHAWPALLAVPIWAYGLMTTQRRSRTFCWILGWTLLAWAALRSPNGAVVCISVMTAFLLLHVAIPALWRLWQLPCRPASAPSPKLQGGAASGATALLVGGLLLLCLGAVSPVRSADLRSAVPQTSGLQPGGISSNPVLLAQASSGRSVSTVRSAGRLEVCGTADRRSALREDALLAESVIQDVRIEDKFASGTAKIRWQAEKGQALPLLFEPAVLTRLSYDTNSLVLVTTPAGSKAAQQLLARKNGLFDVEVRYEMPVTKRDTESGFSLPLRCGLVNRISLTVANLDVDVLCPQAVSIQRNSVGSNTVATIALSPATDVWLAWKPRSRDVEREKAVFYAEVTQLYVPAAGVIEGAHYVSIRPAQGQLSELTMDVPAGATITDVTDAARPAAGADGKRAADSSTPLVSLWRFDPDARKLRVTLAPAQSRPFVLLVRSQLAAGPLPFEQSVGLLSVAGAAGEIGLLGIATGNEVQLDTVTAAAFSPINLEDFPGDAAVPLQAQVPGLTVRRAFRYSGARPGFTNQPPTILSLVSGRGEGKSAVQGQDAPGPLLFSLRASAVEPDVRVETQDTLSLGEDRTVLAVNAAADITRAGIFRLSFVMPPGFDVESISGSSLSHWTESKSDVGRVITLHLTGKTEGQQQFAISLAGPGVKATHAWLVPQVILREASKQRGTLLLVPEQGMRLQVAAREGVTQLDPQKSGIRQKGVLAFRVLQTPWKLSLDLEQVEPWIQVTSLQHATVNEAQVKIVANLQYQIENTGLKAFRVFLPTNAESVRFQGDQLADFLPVTGLLTNGLQGWEVKLHRRVIGSYMLQATYQTLMPGQSSNTILCGVQAGDVNLQRGFVTIQAGGRLQVHADAPPEALQPAEWQSIPRALQQDLSAAAANFTYRLVEPGFQLPLKLERHEAARLLPARIENITMTSVISDAGVMLTRVRLEMFPGDKPTLSLALPKAAQFWFAFVNQNGVWPWRDQDNLLIPLEQQSRKEQAIPVELFYSCAIGSAKPGALDLELLAPKFDLPLEDVTWRVSLSDKWQVKHWSGSLQLQRDEAVPQTALADAAAYLEKEAAIQQERTKEAEGFLAAGNTALDQGDPQQARRAFQAAYGLSTHDAAFNEDARVQLHNIKLQQALVGLNVRQAAVAGEPGALGARFRDLKNRKDVAYTQQDAKDIIDRNSADENAAFMRLAERLIQQQDAAVTTANPIRADIPEQGRVLTFKRAVVVNPQADMKIDLCFSAAKAAPWSDRVLILAGTLAILLAFGLAARWLQPRSDAV
jgi:tetratricopeptide (TPR) repeat protein